LLGCDTATSSPERGWSRPRAGLLSASSTRSTPGRSSSNPFTAATRAGSRTYTLRDLMVGDRESLRCARVEELLAKLFPHRQQLCVPQRAVDMNRAVHRRDSVFGEHDDPRALEFSVHDEFAADVVHRFVACGEPASVQTSRLLSGVFAIDLAIGTTLTSKSPLVIPSLWLT